MRPQTRPFTVETKRTRRLLGQPGAADAASSGNGPDRPGAAEPAEAPVAEDLAPEAGRDAALALAARVFGGFFAMRSS